MGRFFKSKTKQSGYGQAADKRATFGKFSDFPTKIAKKIDTLQTKIDTIVDTYKSVNKSIPFNKKKLITKLKDKIKGLKIGDKKQYEKKAKEQNLQTTKNNPRLKAQMDEMNKEADKIKKLVEEGIITKGEARDKAKALRKKTGRRVGDKERKNLKRLEVDQKNIIKKEPKNKLGNVIESLPTPRRGNGKLRGVGKALRGGGKVMRG